MAEFKGVLLMSDLQDKHVDFLIQMAGTERRFSQVGDASTEIVGLETSLLKKRGCTRRRSDSPRRLVYVRGEGF